MLKPADMGACAWSAGKYFQATAVVGFEQVSKIRREAVETVRRRCPVLGDRLDDLGFVISELLANAVRHGRLTQPTRQIQQTRQTRRTQPSCLRLTVTWDESCVLVRVYDRSRRRPVVRPVDDSSESGRGLFAVQEMTGGRWGYEYDKDGAKVVWAAFPYAVGDVPVARPTWRSRIAGQHAGTRTWKSSGMRPGPVGWAVRTVWRAVTVALRSGFRRCAVGISGLVGRRTVLFRLFRHDSQMPQR